MPKGLGEVSIPNPYQKVKDKLTWSCKYFTNTFSIQSQRISAELLPQLFIPFNLSTVDVEQSDVEQTLGTPSVHSFTLVYLISSQLLLKATDLDWFQVNPFTTEAVDNIHLL